MKKNIEIVIIEDNETLKSGGLIWELEDIYEKVIFFVNPDDGIEYINNNLEKKLIVLLDISFPANLKDGHKSLTAIRHISNNIPVILWSGINENQETFSDFINNNADAYLKKDATTEEALKIIEKIATNLKFSVENTLEEWINQHSETDKNSPIFISTENKSYSLNDILTEIRMQTEVGKDFSKRLTKLTIDLLMRNKERLND